MTKEDFLNRIKRMCERSLKETDWGHQTEYLDRILDQCEYALTELADDEREFLAGCDRD